MLCMYSNITNITGTISITIYHRARFALLNHEWEQVFILYIGCLSSLRGVMEIQLA